MGQPCVPSDQGEGALGPPRALTGMATPQHGDRILVIRPRWLNLLVDDEHIWKYATAICRRGLVGLGAAARYTTTASSARQM